MNSNTTPQYRVFIVCILACWVMVWVGCKQQTRPIKQAPTKRRATSRPAKRPPPKPICKEGEQTHVRCLAYCGARKILDYAYCKHGQHYCENGVRADKCRYPSRDGADAKDEKS